MMLSVYNKRLNNLDEYGQTPLMDAARSGNAERVKHLIDAKSDVNCIGKDTTALISASKGCYTACVERLLEAGVNLNHKDSDDCTAFQRAENQSMYCHRPPDMEKCVRLLAEVGSPIKAIPGNTKYLKVQMCGRQWKRVAVALVFMRAVGPQLFRESIRVHNPLSIILDMTQSPTVFSREKECEKHRDLCEAMDRIILNSYA